jgi:hypothetical protein
MKYNSLTLGKIEAVINKLGGMEGVEAFLSNTQKDQSTFVVTIEEGETEKTLILNGSYDWVNPDALSVCSNDKPVESGTFEMKVIKFDRNISPHEAKEEIYESGWKVADVSKLIAFSITNPNEQRKYPIFSLSYRGRSGDQLHNIFIDGDEKERHINIGDDFDFGDIYPYHRFLVYREIS